ncbi:MAG: cytochrome c [Rhodospirillales bacterium]
MSTNIKKLTLGGCCVIALSLGIATSVEAGSNYGHKYDFGTPASAADIAKVDIDVMPDGRGAPPGQGSYAEGKKVYADKCAACHGADMAKPVKGTGAAPLRGGRDTLTSGKPKKTVESYWPYATTLFDYTKRAMPFFEPGSMTDNEVYAVVAYILAEGNVISKDTVMNAKTLPKVKMPNRDGFIAFPQGNGHRPDIFNYD